jgi:hypothetical protein
MTFFFTVLAKTMGVRDMASFHSASYVVDSSYYTIFTVLLNSSMYVQKLINVTLFMKLIYM